jgi:quercetin dioxygenase-like cupin family protein
MENVRSKIKPSNRKNSRMMNSSLRTFDLPALVEKMKHKNTWANGEIDATVLLKKDDKQIVLAVLHEDTEIKSYQSNDSITFQIIEGELMFHTQKETVTLKKGQILTLFDNVKYRLTTKEETVLLLTILTNSFETVEC